VAIEPAVLRIQLPACTAPRLRPGDDLWHGQREPDPQLGRFLDRCRDTRVIQGHAGQRLDGSRDRIRNRQLAAEADSQLGLRSDLEDVQQFGRRLDAHGSGVHAEELAAVADAPDAGRLPGTDRERRHAMGQQHGDVRSQGGNDLGIRLLSRELPQLAKVERPRFRDAQVERCRVALRATALLVVLDVARQRLDLIVVDRRRTPGRREASLRPWLRFEPVSHRSVPFFRRLDFAVAGATFVASTVGISMWMLGWQWSV